MNIRGLAGSLSLLFLALALAWPYVPWDLLNTGRSGAVCPLVRDCGPVCMSRCNASQAHLCTTPQGFGAADGPSPHRPQADGPDSSSSGVIGPPRLVLYTNARVWTGNLAAPHADAFAVDPATGRFAYVGAASGAPPAARTVDLGGQHVIPGLIDSHVHLINGGLSLSRLDLSSAASRRSFVEAVAAAAAGQPPGGWVLGGGWDEARLGELPSAAWIDEGEPPCGGSVVRHLHSSPL